MGRPSRIPRSSLIALSAVLFSAIFLLTLPLSSEAHTALATNYQQGVYLVFPFENAGASPRHEWLSQGLEELTIQQLSAAGEEIYSHQALARELDRDGLPRTSRLSRASMLHIAEELDADYIVVGRFFAKDSSLTIEARILAVNSMTLQAPIVETGTLDSLMDLQTRLVWRLLKGSGKNYPHTQEDFAKRQHPLRLDAFEHYVRGVIAVDDEIRIRELREAARLEPGWPQPDFALGMTYYVRRDCSSALPWFARVPKVHERYVEAVFATGVCRLFTDEPDRAEDVFAVLLHALEEDPAAGSEIPAILNNLGIAHGRQGKIAAAKADLARASELEPDEDDYPFNLGLLALQGKDSKSATKYFHEATERAPDNAEDEAMYLYATEKSGKKAEADKERAELSGVLTAEDVPVIRLNAKKESLAKLQRIKSELELTALHTVSAESVTVASGAETTLSADSVSAQLRRGRQALSAGKLADAEKEFRRALGQDSKNATAHRGLGEILHREGKNDAAIGELLASLEGRDSAIARTMLAKIYLEQKKNELARTEVERALKIAPNYEEAKKLSEHMKNPKQDEKKPGGVQ